MRRDILIRSFILGVSAAVVAARGLDRLDENEFSAVKRKRNGRSLKKNKKGAMGGEKYESFDDYEDVVTPHPVPSPETPSPVSSRPPSSTDYTTHTPTQKGTPYPPTDNHPSRKMHGSKKRMGKFSSSKSSSRSSSKGGSKSSHGYGGGKGDGKPTVKPPTECAFRAADSLIEVIPEVRVKFPSRCCNYQGPIAVYVTHSEPNDSTPSGLEPFWDTIYTQIEQSSEDDNVCFILTGYDPGASDRALGDILTDATVLASTFPATISMMVTDPTEGMMLVNEIRVISNDPTLPSIGLFNAGYNNLVVESLVSGQDRLPFIGYMNDADFGTEAASFTRILLDGIAALPLCFNGRPDLEFVGERCATYYAELSATAVDPATGVPCSSESLVQEVFNSIVDTQANALLSHVDCCDVVARAAAMAKSMGQDILAVGCMDEDTTGVDVSIDFVTTQPILLQGYSPSSWANFPVEQAMLGKNGRSRQFFPSLGSLVNTAIYTVAAEEWENPA